MIVLENEITFTSMTEENLNDEHADNNENLTGTSIDHTKK